MSLAPSSAIAAAKAAIPTESARMTTRVKRVRKANARPFRKNLIATSSACRLRPRLIITRKPSGPDRNLGLLGPRTIALGGALDRVGEVRAQAQLGDGMG